VALPRGILAAIVAAAAAACQTSAIDGDAGFAGRYHPPGFADPAEHGPALKTSGEDCRGCHGYDLTGGANAPSCDGCHLAGEDPAAWRTRCTFCHGGEADDTGAPPRDIDGDQPISFPAHSAHVRAGVTSGLDCMQCHVKAVDVLSPGHIFDDDTPGVAEVDMGAGLSPQGRFDGAGCGDLYCHGSGRADDGAIAVDAAPQTCTSCHAGIGSDGAAVARMSGPHALHMGIDGASCASCHPGVSADGRSLTDPSRHIDGRRDVAIGEPGVTFNATRKTCTGSCHGFDHNQTGWTGTGGAYHPPGFSAPLVHGPEMELQRQDCRGCHGADLAGGTAVSCDSCHQASWRTDCTYCHGGGLNDTGAPPRDLGSANLSVSQSFVAHPRHVTQTVSRASDCSECHRKPVDVLSPGHAFDDTPAAAEIDFSGGRSPNGVYDRSGTCTNLYCHGNGRGDSGTATDGMPTPTCGGCHADRASPDRWGTMSGHHKTHLEKGYGCEQCHADITADGVTILDPLRHIDRLRQIRFVVTTIAWDPATRRCTGTCHDGHNNTW
jgi:predicted CxxxxCH...CXXCH cytochrome family protein